MIAYAQNRTNEINVLKSLFWIKPLTKIGKNKTTWINTDNASTTNVSIEYLNTKQDGDSGYIWVKYTAEYLDGYGEGFKGSYDVVSRWEIKKENNEWKVTKITEAI